MSRHSRKNENEPRTQVGFLRKHLNILFLLIAVFGAIAAFSPALSAGWIYDDTDYVLNDPRLEHLEVFVPGHSADSVKNATSAQEAESYQPLYQRSLFSDRYLWHLSYAIEHRIFGKSPSVAHFLNLLIHLCVVIALFFAVEQVLTLYRVDSEQPDVWALLPGASALIFAIHPWTSEPVCYVSARDASLGALFGLCGLVSWLKSFRPELSFLKRAVLVFTSLLLAIAAFASKENFLVVPALYALSVWPIMWRSLSERSNLHALAVVGVAIGLLAIVGWIGIQSSERARGLFAQGLSATGWKYFFEIQNPLLLLTLLDQLPAQRLSFETQHPGWNSLACATALLINAALLLGTLLAGVRRPLLLALAWFYVVLLPTNSFLPRPDFLAMRNVYLAAAGTSILSAGLLLSIIRALKSRSPLSGARLAQVCAVALGCFWFAMTLNWSAGFLTPTLVWQRSIARAPDHSAVRLNYAAALLTKDAPQPPNGANQAAAEEQILAALKAEFSPTMAWHTERPRAMRLALAYRMLGNLRVINGRMDEAEKYFSKSVEAFPTVAAWTAWAETCLSQNWREKVAIVLQSGEKTWPAAWWTAAVRGLYLARDPNSITPPILCDLQRAEETPDESTPELRSLQARTIFCLAQLPVNRDKLAAYVERLRRLGTSDSDLAVLKTLK